MRSVHVECGIRQVGMWFCECTLKVNAGPFAPGTHQWKRSTRTEALTIQCDAAFQRSFSAIQENLPTFKRMSAICMSRVGHCGSHDVPFKVHRIYFASALSLLRLHQDVRPIRGSLGRFLGVLSGSALSSWYLISSCQSHYTTPTISFDE